MCNNGSKIVCNIIIISIIAGLFETVLLGHAGTGTSFIAWFWYSFLTCLALMIVNFIIYAISRIIIDAASVVAYIKNPNEE